VCVCVCVLVPQRFLKVTVTQSNTGEVHPWSICWEQVVLNYCTISWCSIEHCPLTWAWRDTPEKTLGGNVVQMKWKQWGTAFRLASSLCKRVWEVKSIVAQPDTPWLQFLSRQEPILFIDPCSYRAASGSWLHSAISRCAGSEMNSSSPLVPNNTNTKEHTSSLQGCSLGSSNLIYDTMRYDNTWMVRSSQKCDLHHSSSMFNINIDTYKNTIHEKQTTNI